MTELKTFREFSEGKLVTLAAVRGKLQIKVVKNRFDNNRPREALAECYKTYDKCMNTNLSELFHAYCLVRILNWWLMRAAYSYLIGGFLLFKRTDINCIMLMGIGWLTIQLWRMNIMKKIC